MNFFTGLRCSKCNLTYPGDKAANLCQCNGPLLVEYDLAAARILDKDEVKNSYTNIWDLAALLPVVNKQNMLTLGEGNTPLLRAKNLGNCLGLSDIYIKEEGLNPTGSFKARGICLAVSRAR